MSKIKATGLALCAALSVTLLSPAVVMADTVRMWTFLNPAGTSPREVALAQIIKDFESANPDIDIVVEPQVWDQMTPKFLAAHGNRSAPDIIWVVTDFLGDAIQSGSLADLNELFINKWSEEKKADFKDAYWNLTSVQGKQYGLFASRNYIALMYRPDLFANAGIKPEDIKTWDDLKAVAQKLTVKDSGNKVTRYGFSAAYSEQQADPHPVIPHILASGEPLFTTEGKANFASDAGVKGMQFFTGMVKDGISPSQAATWTVDDLFEQFASDRIAMVQGSAVRVSTLQGKLGKDKVALMSWPGAVAGKPSPSVMAGWSVGIWSGSKVKASAAKFMDFMMSDPGDKIWTAVGGQIPGKKSTLKELENFISQPGNGYLAVAARGAAEAGWLTPIDFSVGGYRQALNRATQQIIVDGKDVKAALKEAEEHFNRQNGR
ncbi:ABC transporter substrate-binding protein [Microvirga guangxiensis]|uniref:Carbohydrate ABC transporter substrate-binding protein, CUT1 family n=1 Tax=Microvirga guangxiensis TaxID=549386 RepID=A0A1G5KLZ3_9HYPH|nr:sugar ABC transporter substrate-binding protein [Microvirga guangxiensis]SCZ01364.1 carbohydrate ABC transporter substrate-binding protein, CUT1 family [Microvirga guangxiensis]